MTGWMGRCTGPLRVLLADGNAKRRMRVTRWLRASSADVAHVGSVRDVLGCVLVTSAPQLLLIDAALPELGGIAVCDQLRRRQLGPVPPRVVLMGDCRCPRDLLRAFEAGANDWLLRTDREMLERHLPLQFELARCAGLGLVRNAALLRALGAVNGESTGAFRVSVQGLRASLELRAGRLAWITFEAQERPFMRVVENEVRCSPSAVQEWRRWTAQVSAGRKPNPGEEHDPFIHPAALDWRGALTDWGLTERARLRDAVKCHWRHALSTLLAFQGCEISWQPCDVIASPELTFAPQELLSDSEHMEHAPHSYTRGSVAFLPATPHNDVRVADVS